jgi:hypothetical protein
MSINKQKLLSVGLDSLSNQKKIMAKEKEIRGKKRKSSLLKYSNNNNLVNIKNFTFFLRVKVICYD